MSSASASAAPRPEILVGEHDREQLPLSLATAGIVRYVWQSAFGPILIEVRDGVSFVNGQPVVPIAETERPEPADDRAVEVEPPPLRIVE